MTVAQRQQYLLIATIVVVALLLGDKVLFTPLSNVWTKHQQQIKDMQKNLRHGQATLRSENNIRVQWAKMQANSLPNTDATQAQEQLIGTIRQWAQDSQTTINGITPQWKDGDGYRTLECHVDASGALGNLNRFLFDMQKGQVGLKLESLDLTTRDPNGQQLALGLQVSGLVLLTQPE